MAHNAGDTGALAWADAKDTADTATAITLAGKLDKSEASGTYGTRRNALTDINEDFTTYPDGVLTTTQSGLPYVSYPASPDACSPRVESGSLTYGTTATQGGYASVQLAEAVTRVGAKFFYDANTTNAGLATMAIFEKEIGASIGAGTGVPRSPVHFWVTPTHWSFSVFVNENEAPTELAAGDFAVPLAADGVTVHTAEVILDRTNGVAYLRLPDGNTIVVTSVNVKRLALWVTFEPFRNLTTENRARFVSAWASTHSDPEITAAKVAIRNGRGSTWFAESTSPGVDTALAGVPWDVPGAVVTYATPADGKVLVTLSATITEATVGDIYFCVKYLGGGNIVQRMVCGDGFVSITVPLYLDGFAGYMRQISFGLMQGGGAHTVKLATSYTASIKVQHYQS